jgi:uncharacterized protein (TIGR00369 family)
MEFKVVIPFVESLGFELLAFGDGASEIAVELREELTNSWSVAHGGVTMTLLDVAMAHAARSTDPQGPGVVTVEMKTTFLRPGLGRLVGRGKLLHRSTSLAFCEGSVSGGDGALIAHATGTFKYMRGLPAGGRRIQRDSASD